jgi:hypothetical protein
MPGFRSLVGLRDRPCLYGPQPAYGPSPAIVWRPLHGGGAAVTSLYRLLSYAQAYVTIGRIMSLGAHVGLRESRA